MELSFKICLPREGATVPIVRHLCRDTLQRLGIEDDCVSDIELAVTEACANVLHAADPDMEYEVQIEVTEASCEIRVIDAGPGFDHATTGLEVSPETAEGGRGIFLMRSLVDDLSFVSKDGNGTMVYLCKALSLKPDSLLLVLNS